MGRLALSNPSSDDPLRLRSLLQRAGRLARHHALGSVVVGFAGAEDDLYFGELIDFIGSELRVEDGLFRMTPNRAVLVLCDLKEDSARGVIERLLEDFRSLYVGFAARQVRIGFYEIPGDARDVTVKQVLPTLFARAGH